MYNSVHEFRFIVLKMYRKNYSYKVVEFANTGMDTWDSTCEQLSTYSCITITKVLLRTNIFIQKSVENTVEYNTFTLV